MLLVNILCLYLISVTAIAIFCGAHIKTLNGSNYIQALLLLCTAVSFYIFGYAMELNSSSISQISFWNHVEYIGIPFVSALWLTVALIYTGRFILHKKILLAAIFVIPIITFVFRFTNNYHHLYFSSVSHIRVCGKLFLVKKSGPWLYVQLIHSMLMVLIAMGLYVYDSLKRENKQKGNILLTITASVFAVAGLFLSQIKPLGPYLDYMALCLPVSCVLVVLAILQYDLLETSSIARGMSFESSSDAILLINRQNKVIDYNSSAKELFSQINIGLNNGYLSTLFCQVPNLLKGLEKTETSVIKLCINNEERYYDVTTKNLGNESARGLIKTIRDVTQIYQLNEELKKLALTDELSTLNNRRAFIQIGKECILKANESGRTLHLIMFDLDCFKNVNDQYGHAAGDMVIHNFGKMLKSHFGAGSLIARLGGEEFAVLQADLTESDMLQSLNTFLKNTENNTYTYLNSQYNVTVSIGVTKKQPDQTLESMMSKADKALYQSKDRGRNCITLL